MFRKLTMMTIRKKLGLIVFISILASSIAVLTLVSIYTKETLLQKQVQAQLNLTATQLELIHSQFYFAARNKNGGQDGDMLSATAFVDALKQRQLSPGINTILLDEDGSVIFADREVTSENNTLSPFVIPLLERPLGTTPGLLTTSIHVSGIEYAAIGQQLALENWRYFKLIPVDVLVEPFNLSRFNLIVASLLFSLLCTILLSRAIYYVAVKHLDLVTSALRKNDSTGKDGHTLDDNQVARTTKEFDVMSERVARYIHRIMYDKDKSVETQQRWELALQGTGGGIWDWNIETDEIVHSSQWENMLGNFPEVMLNSYSAFVSLLHPEDKERVRNGLDAFLAGNPTDGEGYAIEYRIRCKNDDWKWVLSRGVVASRDEALKPIRMIGTYTDISDLKQFHTENEENAEQLRALLMDSPIAVRIASNHGHKVVFINNSYADLVNKTPDETFGIDPIHYYANQEDYAEIVEQVLNGQTISNRLTHLSVPGEGFKWVLATYSTITYEAQDCIIGWFYDVTDRMKAEETIRLHASVFDNTWEGIVITDAQNTIITVNKAYSIITGYEKEELVGRNPNILSSGRQDPNFYKAMWEQLNTKGYWRGEVWNRKKNGEIYAEFLTVSVVRDDRGEITHYVGVFADITEIKNTERKLENMAHYDGLTQLPNRTLLSDRLEQALGRTARAESILAVCFMDLDGFKPINDSYGHDVGDQLLIEIARRLEFNIRSGDTVARLGGDEFVILLSEAESIEQLDPILTRLIAAVSEDVRIGDQLLSVSASIGVAVYPLDDVDADTLIRHADLAMYEAKQSGRNGYHIFDATLDRQMHEHHEKIEQVRLALNNGEFELYYQPKVNLRSGTVEGMEALIRWQHPQDGLIKPIEFLPLIESNELIINLGDWIILEVLRQIQQWQDEGQKIQVSINVAAKQIQDVEFIDKLEDALMQYSNVSPELVELEILETSALETRQSAQVIHDAAQKLGVSFALDDFGTGYSSLAYLKQLSVTTLKIDQTFIRDMLDDLEDQAIVEGIIELAKVFRRKVVAEGVETDRHAAKLLEMGCEVAQGYGIARPMPANEVLKWVENYQQGKVASLVEMDA